MCLCDTPMRPGHALLCVLVCVKKSVETEKEVYVLHIQGHENQKMMVKARSWKLSFLRRRAGRLVVLESSMKELAR